MSEVTIKDLLESGVHFGHQTRRWNPKMKKFIFTERNNIYIIDLHKTQRLLKRACDAVRETAARGESVLFVGTKPQAASILKSEAERCGQYYATTRWLGGMLTNYRTIRQSIKRLENIEKMAADGTYERHTKKEIQNFEKQRERLSYVLDGIRDMPRLPGLLIVVDTRKEKIAVAEAERLGIPVCAILDTNCDPDPITYPVPGNDDAIRSISLLIGALTDAIVEGTQMRVDESDVAAKEDDDQATAGKHRRAARAKADADVDGKSEEDESGNDNDEDTEDVPDKGKAAAKKPAKKSKDEEDEGDKPRKKPSHRPRTTKKESGEAGA